jgi:cytochrome c oxidase subunit 3
MSNQTAVIHETKTGYWGGGESPYNVSWGKLYMWIFLMSDAFTFSSLLIAYGTLRHKFGDSWPIPGDVFHHFPFYHGEIKLAYVGLMTFILIMSSVTMVLAVEAGHRNSKKEVMLWMFLTIIGGLMFLGSQAWEWYHFITGSEEGKMIGGKLIHGANLSINEYGNPLFGDFFFFITGFHGFHVFSGVCINTIVFILVARGFNDRKKDYELVEKVGLYWHFVDLVWVFVFTFFYLI